MNIKGERVTLPTKESTSFTLNLGLMSFDARLDNAQPVSRVQLDHDGAKRTGTGNEPADETIHTAAQELC